MREPGFKICATLILWDCCAMLIFSFHLRNGAAVEGPLPREVGAYAATRRMSRGLYQKHLTERWWHAE